MRAWTRPRPRAMGRLRRRTFSFELWNVVFTRVPEERAALVERGGKLVYSAEGNINLIRGAVEFAVQPLTEFTDNRNHYFLCLGQQDQPNCLVIWKTEMYNDLRFRINGPDGEHVDAIMPDVGAWTPGQWHHVIGAWDLEQGWLRLYVDGSQRGLRTGVQFQPGPLPVDFAIGSDLDGKGVAEALIDDVRITDRPPPGRQPQVWFERSLRSERISSTNAWQGTVDSLSLALVPKPDLTFVVISDPHVSGPGALGRYQHNHRVMKLVEQMNAFRPAFVLDCGDIVTTFPGRDDFEACAKRSLELFKVLRVPVYHAPGNHDVGNKLQITYHGDPGPEDVYKRGWYVNDDNLKQYRDYFGPDWYSFDYEGCHVIVLNNALMNSGLPDEAKQLEWLKQDLEAAKESRLLFVAVHNPLFWVGTDDFGTENYEVVNQPMRGDLIDLFDQYDVQAVFTGHTHHRISNYLRGTKYLTLPSTTFARNFGDSYGLNGLQVVWDPERVGYYVVRVYGDQTRINLVRTYAPLPPLAPLQEGNDALRVRALGRKSAEVGDDGFGVKSAPPPRVQRSIWHIMGIVDGVKPDDCPSDQVAAYCWTSNVHPFDDQHEWLQVTLPEPKPVRQIVFYPRPGNFGFPLDFAVQVSEDGNTWETVARREAFKPEPDAAEKGIAFDLGTPRPVLAAKMDMTKLSDRDHTNIRAAMMEVELRGEEGDNHALESLGALATSGTQAGGDRKTVDDHFWSEPTQAGAKWCVLPEDGLSWEDVEPSAGRFALPPHVMRAFTLGHPPGLKFVIPISPEHERYPVAGPDALAQAFGDYVAFMARTCPKGSGWKLNLGDARYIAPEHLTRLLATYIEAIRRADPQATLLLGDFELDDQGSLRGPAGIKGTDELDGVVVRLEVGDAPETSVAEALKAVRSAGLPTTAWLQLVPPQGPAHDEIARAKLMARAMVLSRAERMPAIHWAAPGEPGGLLNRFATPEPGLFAYRSVATLLSGARPIPTDEVGTVAGEVENVEIHAFRAEDGSRLVALWQRVPPDENLQPAVCRIRPAGATGTAIGVDGLTCTLQELVSEDQGGDDTIEGLQVRDWPLIVRLAK